YRASTTPSIYSLSLHDALPILLILDDFGLQPLDQNLRLALLQILEDRYGKRPIAVASQLPVAEWYNYLGEPTLADAILDRLTAKDRKSTRLNSSHVKISYAVFC